MVDRERAEIFGVDAEAYDRARPGYPDEVVDLVLADHPAAALDVGCGTGKAARAVHGRGVEVVGIEPDERMAAVARRHGIEVVVTRFEDWVVTPFECVFSAQAWHWVDPFEGAAKAADTLPPGGRWSAFWNDDHSAPFAEALVRAYERHAPHLALERGGDGSRRGDPIDRTVAGLQRTGRFGRCERHEVAWTDDVDVGLMVERLSTTSAHRLLPDSVARRVHAALIDELGGAEVALSVAYTTMVLTSRRR